MTGSYIKVLNTHIYLYKQGSGPPLLFIHGHRADTLRCQKIIELLTPHFTVFSPDLPGFGKSSSLKNGPHDLKNLSFYLKALVEQLNLTNLSVCGISMGGMIALLLTPTIEERMNKLILLATPSSKKYFKIGKIQLGFLKGLLFLVGKTNLSSLADKIVQSNRILGWALRRSFPLNLKDNQTILAYEIRQWRVMPMKIYAQSALSCLNFELPKNWKINLPAYIFSTHSDHLVDMDLSVNLLQKLVPQTKVFWLNLNRHVPRGEIDNQLLALLKPQIELALR